MFRKTLVILLLIISCVSEAQTKLKTGKGKLIMIKNAESLSYDGTINRAKILKGNVICEHDGALLYCDSALIYDEENRMEASGNILITKGDSIRVTGEKLTYDGKTKLAVLENNVKCVEKDMILTTQLLTFDVGSSIANYYNGGTIVNKENTLVSKNGHYYSATKEAAFHYDVVLTNPDYKMNSDTLRYKISTKTSYFLGPSIILSKSDYIYCENGWYDTDKERAQFSKNALLVTSQQKLKGDSLVYDRNTRIGRAFRNVTLIDTSQKSIVYGDYIEYKEFHSEALITKRALYARIIEDDTLFIAADTMYHRDIDSVNNFLNAYHHVKLYKKNLQSICDSASLNTKDSLLQLFRSPILWGNRMQATAKVIKVEIGKNTVKGFTLDQKAFLIQQEDSLKPEFFNQIAGKTIEGWISNDTIRKIFVNGSAEILYFPFNKGKPVALNKTTANQVTLWFTNGDIERISFIPKTEGNIDPIKDVNPESARLKGFNWQYNKRPLSRYELHKKEVEKSEDRKSKKTTP